jgi:N-carbamoylputrescine amidase
MPSSKLTVAVVTDAFPEEEDWKRLPAVLERAKGLGGDLAVLPELPLNPWSPAGKEPREQDVEDVNGPRQRLMARAAAEAGIALLGGAIVREPRTGARHNTALLYDAEGSCHLRYRKVHLPEEEGYWETSHYEAGIEPPGVSEELGMRLGIQLCSDVNRTTGLQILAEQGVEAVLAPRCTPPQSYERWRLVLRAGAVTACAYVISANRPAPVPGGLIGGPSLVIAPSGEILLETTDPLALTTLDQRVAQGARREYPGYLRRYPRLYARWWEGLGESS